MGAVVIDVDMFVDTVGSVTSREVRPSINCF